MRLRPVVENDHLFFIFDQGDNSRGSYLGAGGIIHVDLLDLMDIIAMVMKEFPGLLDA